MLQQEASTDPFMEEEVVEAVLPGLNWRAEGRVQRPVLVRGGIVADEVSDIDGFSLLFFNELISNLVIHRLATEKQL